MNNSENSVLKKLFPNETIKVKATSGRSTIAKSEEVFKFWLDLDFEGYDLDNPQRITKEIPVEVYEIVANADFKTIFTSLDQNIDNLCLTQNQIVEFCKNYRNYLRSTWTVFFLFKENNEYFVADVYVSLGGLVVYIQRFEDAYVWFADHRHHVVVPVIL